MGVAQVLLRGSVKDAICVVLGQKSTLGKLCDRLPVRDLERAPGGLGVGEGTGLRVPNRSDHRAELVCEASAGLSSTGSAGQGVEPLVQALALGGAQQRAREAAREGTLPEKDRRIEQLTRV